MPNPGDLRKFQSGQPLQRYLNEEHLNAVLEAMRIIDSSSSSDHGGIKRAAGHLRSKAPGILNRDIIFAKNTTFTDYWDEESGWVGDRFHGIRKFQAAVIYPPEEIRSDKSDEDRFRDGYVTFSARQYHPDYISSAPEDFPDLGNSVENHPTVAIALHDIPSCSVGLFLISGHSARFSSSTTEARNGMSGASLSLAIYDAPYQVTGALRDEFPSPSGGDTLDGGGSICEYTCVEDTLTSGTGYEWYAPFGACGPNSECPILGNCTEEGATTTAPCQKFDWSVANSLAGTIDGTQSISMSVVDNYPAMMNHDGLAICTDVSGEWQWWHIGSNCFDGVVNGISEKNLPPCTEDLCGKWRPSKCEVLPTTTAEPTTTTTTTIPPCRSQPSTEGYCWAECGYDDNIGVWRFMVLGDPDETVNTACASDPDGCTGLCCLSGGGDTCGIPAESGWCNPALEGVRIPGVCRAP